MSTKKKSKFNTITKIVVWIMLIATVGSVVVASGIALYNFFN